MNKNMHMQYVSHLWFYRHLFSKDEKTISNKHYVQASSFRG